jgi:hypothetical protein
MSMPSDPHHERENVLAERTVETVVTAEALTVTERQDVNIHVDHDDFDRDPGRLSHHQRTMLRQLTRLHHSLRGPQTMLEAAGHFNRPPFPAPHPKSR